MDLYIIDFDKQFQKYLRQWLRTHKDVFQNADEVEAKVPDLYEAWLDQPADWLEGETPNRYFYRYEQPEVLVQALLRYLSVGVGAPDPLLDRLSAFGKALEPHVMAVIRGQTSLPRDLDEEEAMMVMLGLLQEIGSAPLEDYLRLILDSPEGGAVAEAAGEALKAMEEEAVVEPALAALETAGPAAQDCLLDVLANFPGDKRIYRYLARRFQEAMDQKALYASYLGKYGDPEALPLLEEALTHEDMTYLDYLEIRNAIEELGGHVTAERDFSGDEFYESLKHLEEGE